MSETTDDFLQHYGVVGMKWGRRKGSLVDRLKGAALDSNQRRRTTNNAIATGNGKLRDYTRVASYRAGGLAFAGSKKFAAKRVKDLDGQKERIQSGKLKAHDILQLSLDLRPIDLVVSRRDARG